MTTPMSPDGWVRLTCHVPHRLTPLVRKIVESAPVPFAFSQTSRSIQIRERSIPFFSGGIPSLEETLSDTLLLYVPQNMELPLMRQIIFQAGLDMADRGSVYSQNVEVAYPKGISERYTTEFFISESDRNHHTERRLPIVDDLAAISCIVPRGTGSAVARLAIEMGTSVPFAALARGTGHRDRLGLLRITVPAEKELVTVAVPGTDAPTLAGRIIESGRFDQPGAGFVYLSHLGRGLVNIRLWLGSRREAASINQVVAAVDALWGSAAWRRRFRNEETVQNGTKNSYLHNLNEITIISREEQTRSLLQVALGSGAGGATTSRVVPIKTSIADGLEGPGGALELTTLIVSDSQTSAVIHSLQEVAVLPNSATGQLIFVTSVPWAFSYRRKTVS